MESEDLKHILEEAKKIREETLAKLAELGEKLSSIEASYRNAASEADLLALLVEARKLESELKNLKFAAKTKARELLLRAASRYSPGSPVYSDLKDYIEDVVDEGMFDELEDRLDDVIDSIKDSLRGRRGRRRFPVVAVEVPGGVKVVKGDFRVLDEALREIDRIIREALSGSWLRAPSTIISSVRLPQADLSVIDLLVEAGIFKSRNEGIAFFVHKGIECSRDWLEKVRSKVEEIHRLQEETRKELEGILGGQEEGIKEEDGEGSRQKL
ncbi:hypothetical protein IG193_07930 [Infirmifilum lucidum]|uniref:Uncharacterized protein n=1 Tax=Infirmifilum lucidum TaxID=2776706 RepID=A0A7L9FH59_9CREN|nr:hypothetical protein [Infirmifilum lucidum]QOJ78672.1 hypothetical protein IG193_07930 [Infirmifilum lucidum]